MLKKSIFRILMLLVAFLFFEEKSGAETMKVVSATVHQYQTPVLVRNEINPLFHVKIETSGDENPVLLNELNIELSGTDIINDIGKVEVFYTENNPLISEGFRFATPEKPENKITFIGKQELKNGTNIFSVSVQLNDNANILNTISGTCISLKINDEILVPEVPEPITMK
jgi:hypothetical protein